MYTIATDGSDVPDVGRPYRVPPRCPYAQPQAWLRTRKFEEFRLLYTLVTRDLRAYLRDATPAFGARGARWFRFLISGFLAPSTSGPTRSLRGTSALSMIRVPTIGFAFPGTSFSTSPTTCPERLLLLHASMCAGANAVQRNECRSRYLGAATDFPMSCARFSRDDIVFSTG
ncbi:MAG TPA: hypothetical protein VGJ81_22925 [Thermoanaerobaculia bacterium]|jgi:hypothetical protein